MQKSIRISVLFVIGLCLLGRCSDDDNDSRLVIKDDPIPDPSLNELGLRKSKGGRVAASCGGYSSGSRNGMGYYTYPDVVINVIPAGSNLIRNESFETRKSGTNCPIGPWQNQPTQGFPDIWTYGFRNGSVVGTPDYLQTCADINSGYNPNAHIYGAQAPRTGNSMGGILASVPGTQGGTFAEYFIQEFTSPLLQGRQYQVEFYISLADQLKYACNGIGAYFTNDFSTLTSTGEKPNYDQFTPQIPNSYPTAYQIDKTGWTKISGTYTPSISGVKWIVIGNFRPDNRLMLSSPDPGTNNSYYYIDDVSVVEAAGSSNLVVNFEDYEIPNRFTLYNSSGSQVATTGWVGYADYQGPWGMSLSNGSTASLSTPAGSATLFTLRVETCPPSTTTDGWTAAWGCN
jgi:hypothetical protein